MRDAIRRAAQLILTTALLPATTLSFVRETPGIGRAGAVLPAVVAPSSRSVGATVIRRRKLPSSTSVSSSSSASDDDFEASASRFVGSLLEESKEIAACASLVLSAALLPPEKVEAEDLVKICDEIDAVVIAATGGGGVDSGEPQVVSNGGGGGLRAKALEMKRYQLLSKLMQKDYDAYCATASFLSPSRIPRRQLPNVQDVPMIDDESAGGVVVVPVAKAAAADPSGEEAPALVDDCKLDDMKYNDSPLDVLLLWIFRKLVAENTNGVTSDKAGIEGLLEQGRKFMLQPGQTPGAQHKMVYDTLAGLMTPVLPPFYRIFMSGIVPKIGTEWDGKQIGPWFYAPWLTTIVTPTFFGFLVGPSYPNRRKDGRRGGLVVEKCKFLQESGCKGLCLHQCKLPAQQFFKEELGLPLTVSPNFATQECQWSFGEDPLPPSEDESFPKGCLAGCESRKAIAAMGSTADVCN